ncbi:hypothetical protein JOC34_000449 [Virgibacillus halotolerans]|uniref:hypothetical protein n=1 Tax=Virgibacillus halotolerans TaxID=1071053 RepID=UPI001961DC1F|nr:hypothetical protein [Virgibacillus halotolerans]MBM7598092.1 hypothetical protein [Virgibacillus halotolerans]
MEHKKETIDNLFDYYTNQIFKILYLFENSDLEGYKHVGKIKDEIYRLDKVIPEVHDNYQCYVLLLKLEHLYNRMLFMDGAHKNIKNHVMESCNLVKEIREVI